MIICCSSQKYYQFFLDKAGSDKFLGISIDTIFTALITIGIFILGFWLNKKNDERKEYDLLIEVRSYFLQLLDILIESTKKQLEAFGDFINELKEEKENDYVIQSYSGFTTYDIDQIPNEKLFKIFVYYKLDSGKQDAIKLFKEMITKIGLIRNISGSWQKQFQDFLESWKRVDEEYNRNARLVEDFINKTVHLAHKAGDISNDDFLKRFDTIVLNWQKMDNHVDKFVMMKHLIEPLHKLCQETPKDTRTLDLVRPIMGCIYAFANKMKLNEVYIGLFTAYKTRLEEAKKGIKDSINAIEKLKDKKPGII